MTNEPSLDRLGRRRRRYRLTRRGRVVLIVSAALVTAAAVLVPLLIMDARESKDTEPLPKSLVVPEGWRATQVYDAVDKALEVAPGTTGRTAARMKLKLPAEAKENPEGYLFPATYPIDARTTPKSLLSFMVNTAHARFGTERILKPARRTGLSVYQAVSIASIVQAEADTPTDMGKVARVIHNRLARAMPLQMDSTLNYALRRSTVDTTAKDTRLASPYNTYAQKGLPPTPIGNPGEVALRAAIAPPAGDWLYFVTVGPGDTRFTSSYEEHQRNVEEFNANRERGGTPG
ncbi:MULTISPECIES: endolytic transglycosylase MltG [unclassified Streptomyces]|uniref:endolytic transglycosylase MltG n=1 Tax=unclassified Streptomyces TaxID=2593676 RepID=UPI00365194D5